MSRDEYERALARLAAAGAPAGELMVTREEARLLQDLAQALVVTDWAGLFPEVALEPELPVDRPKLRLVWDRDAKTKRRAIRRVVFAACREPTMIASDARDDLTNIIRACVTDGAGNIRIWSERGIADAILAAGYGNVAAARREALEQAVYLVAPRKDHQPRDAIERLTRDVLDAAANNIRALIDQPAPPATDYPALCALVVQKDAEIAALKVERAEAIRAERELPDSLYRGPCRHRRADKLQVSPNKGWLYCPECGQVKKPGTDRWEHRS